MILEFRDEYNWLSNFYLVDILYKGEIYPSVEHAYMSAKSDDPEWKNQCMDRSIKPGKIKQMSQEIPIIKGWDKKKLKVMYDCLKVKYNQEPFKTKLLATGTQNIQEGNYHNDEFWGVNIKKIPNYGENYLGRLIMEIRKQLKK